jgi:hypothetical protein
MAPALIMLGKYLIANGLPLVANAILSTGKQVVEEKLGVKLEPNMSPELLKDLKMREIQHQEFLIEAAMRKQTLDQEDFRLEVGDKDSARKRDMEYLKGGRENWRAHTMYLLAVAGVAVLVWATLTSQAIDEYGKGIITLVLGRALGYLDNIYNFEFGTTRGSRQKDATIDKLAGGGE